MQEVPSGPRFYSRKAGRWLPLAEAWPLPQAPAVAALDRRLRVPGARRVVTIRALFETMRAAGVRPHCGEPCDDDRVAERWVRLCLDVEDGPSRRSDPGVQVREPEADTAPSAWFGVAEPACPLDDDEQGVGVWGRYDQIIGDLRDMGCGAIRRCKYRDVYWGSIFPDGNYDRGSMVLPPAELIAALRRDDFALLAPFTELVMACLMSGIKMTITPFDPGGGSAFSVASPGGAVSLDINAPLVDGATWAQVFANRPAWQQGIRVPSTQGWDAFYWNHGHPTDDEQIFERFAIHLWPTRESDPVSSTAYARECARRKSLGIAAFCQGIAEHLAALDSAWARLLGNRGITEVVEFVELGNELNGLFVVPDDHTDPDVARASALEAGRTMALLAQPFRSLLPAMKFRAAELSSWHAEPLVEPLFGPGCLPAEGCCITDTFAARVGWLRETIGEGLTMAHSVELLNQYSYAVLLSTGGATLLSADAIDWALTCFEAGYAWPPMVADVGDTLSFGATSLVHNVGIHWFHGQDHDDDGAKDIPRYQDAARMAADLDLLRSVVVDGLSTTHGFSLVMTAGAVAFPAVYPQGLEREDVKAPYYQETSTLLQAAMLARTLCLFQAAGAHRTSWFCPYLKPMAGGSDRSPDQWNSEGVGTGLHNDVYTKGEYLDFAAQGAWRRPAWFTYRRLSWLLSLADGPGTIIHNENGRTVIRYRLRSALSMRPFGLGHRYLWVAWVDQYADSDCLHAAYRLFHDPPVSYSVDDNMTLILADPVGRSYELVSLVPMLTEHIRVGEVDDNGYRQVSDRDWSWAGWDGALLDHRQVALGSEGRTFSIFTMQKCSTSTAQAPVVILSGASEGWVR